MPKTKEYIVWFDPYFVALNPAGRLAFMYCLSFINDNKPVIIEDMANATGLDMSVCQNYFDKFVRDNAL